MAPITPDTQIRLLHVELNLDGSHQLKFANETAQRNYFLSLPHDTELDNCTYQRKDGVIRYNKNIDSILNYNYVMYKNNNFSNKWFYAYIESMEFANPNTTFIKIKTDVFQTWQFEMNMKRCFVEREHTNDDTIGNNLLLENVETGEYKINSVQVDSNLDDPEDIHYYLATTLDLAGVGSENPLKQSGGGVYNGVYSGANYWRFSRANYLSIKNIIQWIASCGQLDGIVGLFLCPSFLDSSESNKVAESTTAHTHSVRVNRSYGLDGYTPKNNKLYTYPYCFIGATNGGGDYHIYKYEYFNSAYCDFNVYGLLAPGGSIRLVPKSYNGQAENNQEIMTLGKFPICNYNVDMYTNWLTQNSVNVGGKTLSTDDLSGLNAISSGVFGTVGNVVNGNVLGAGQSLISGFTGISSAIAQKKQHELMSNAVKGDINNGDIVTATGNNNFKFYHMSVRSQFAKTIDEYFSMYGYATNRVKIPNITGRTNWNYVKTIGSNIEGNIPQNDLIELENLFNRGLTLWHNPNTFKDYSQNNSII